MAILSLNPDANNQYDNAQLLKQGIWHDPQTGLIWMRCAVGQQWENSSCRGEAKKLGWKDAVLYTDKLSYAEKTGWRLPTAKELTAFLDHGKALGFQVGDQPFFGNHHDELWTLTHTPSTATIISVQDNSHAAEIVDLSDSAYVYAVQSSNFQQKTAYFKLVTELDPAGSFKPYAIDSAPSHGALYGVAVIMILLIIAAVHYFKKPRALI